MKNKILKSFKPDSDFSPDLADVIAFAKDKKYLRALEKLEEISSSFKGVEKTFAIQAGREVRIMVKPEDVNDESIALVAREIAERIENELEYPGQIKINVVRETRAIEYAK